MIRRITYYIGKELTTFNGLQTSHLMASREEFYGCTAYTFLLGYINRCSSTFSNPQTYKSIWLESTYLQCRDWIDSSCWWVTCFHWFSVHRSQWYYVPQPSKCLGWSPDRRTEEKNEGKSCTLISYQLQQKNINTWFSSHTSFYIASHGNLLPCLLDGG